MKSRFYFEKSSVMHWAAVLLLGLFAQAALAQGALRVGIAQDSLQLGDAPEVLVSLRLPDDTRFTPIDYSIWHSQESVDVLEAKEFEVNNGLMLQRVRLLLMQEGRDTLPPLALVTQSGSGAVDTLYSTPLIINVRPNAAAMRSPLLDNKGNWWEGIHWLDYWPVYALVLTALLIALWLWYDKRRRREPDLTTTLPPAPVVPAHERALHMLAGLEQKQYWAIGELKQHYDELSGILRAYIEARFGIPAPEQTSAETLAALQQQPTIEAAQQAFAKALLERADMVKFAKARPEAASAVQDLQLCKDWVLATQSLPEPEPNDETPNTTTP